MRRRYTRFRVSQPSVAAETAIQAAVIRALERARRNPKHLIHEWSRAVSPGIAHAFLRFSNLARPKE
jgi:hypothetical protein